MKAIIFDLQGTLIENGIFPSPIKQVRFILNIRKEFKDFVPVFENALLTSAHPSLSDGFKNVTDVFNVKADNQTMERLVGMWNKNKLLSKPFSDTVDTLETLKKDYELVLVANIDCFTKDVITKFDLQKYFSHIYLSYDLGMLKTNPEFYKNILKDLELKNDDVIMVGDSLESDMRPASHAGIRTILIDRNGRQEYSEKISTLSELKNIL